ncbi:MAG TPA: decaprenyl-phosphate phosphoribosyltransferase [Solirubrobacteraceae bacterium]
MTIAPHPDTAPVAAPRPRHRPSPRPSTRVLDAEAHPVTPLRRPAGGARAWVRAARPRQWTKNLLVFGAPLAAGALSQPGVFVRVSLTAVAFCLLSTGVYLFNDVCDAAEDRRHPVKRHRPIASGAVPAGRALAAGAASILLGAALSAAISSSVLVIAAGYALLNVSYTMWLRRVAIADIAAIAGAFVCRAAAGGIAAGVPISRWFIVVVSFAALFVAAGKRYADFVDPAARRSRPVLEQYTAEFLRLVLTVACAVALGAYCLWAFEVRSGGGVPWRAMTICPFTIAVLRYGLLVSTGNAGAPEQVMFTDRFIQIVGAAWLVMFGLGV